MKWLLYVNTRRQGELLSLLVTNGQLNRILASLVFLYFSVAFREIFLQATSGGKVPFLNYCQRVDAAALLPMREDTVDSVENQHHRL